ncbi:galactokinase [Pontibacter sp. CAU 1760]
MHADILEAKFKDLFHSEPLLVRSPGRINLIGEHTDYNEGFVLPAAIDKQMVLAVAKNDTQTIRLFASDLDRSAEFSLEGLKPSAVSWANYILGVVDQLQKAGHKIGGFDCVFGGDIPMGSGLSSSAALECGAGYALIKLFDLEVDNTSLVRFAQQAEHTFAGVQCGIMDQFASVMGKEMHALRLDCRSLDFSYFPIQLQDYQLVLCDTQVKHSLASSAYNTRRSECETGVAAVQTLYPKVNSLRDVNLEMLQEAKAQLSEDVYKRCTYVIEENERLLSGCELLEKGDIKGFGEKMYGSHKGLSELYEVSCPELDFLVEATQENQHVVGARMMGGGFGGCTLNLVAKAQKDSFVQQMAAAYQATFGIDLKTYEVNVTDGTGLLPSARPD